MNEQLIRNAQTYAARYQLALAERLGDGIHGEQRWETVQAILAKLEDFGIHLADVNPGNIAF